MNRIYILVITVLTLASCTRNAGKVKLPKSEKLLVVQCLISPNKSQINVNVNWTEDYFNNPNQGVNTAVSNCIVELTTNGIKYTLPELGTGLYSIDSSILKIVPGQTYSLYVKEPKGKEATAICTVPEISNSYISFASLDSQVLKGNNFEQKNFIFNFNIYDDGNKKDYYDLYTAAYFSGWTYLYDQFGNIVDSTWQTNRQDTYLDIDLRFKDDQDFNGQTKKISIHMPEPQSIGPGGPRTSGSRYDTIEVLNVQGNEAYYKYHKSILTFSQNNGDPFSEPTIIYSNINGGIGIFAAYIEKRIVVKL